jgi:hypothetical protein
LRNRRRHLRRTHCQPQDLVHSGGAGYRRFGFADAGLTHSDGKRAASTAARKASSAPHSVAEIPG